MAASDGALVALDFEHHWRRAERRLKARFGQRALAAAGDPAGAVSALCAWLDGEIDALEAVRVDLAGTEFQRKVWSALREIPGGRTWSYARLARRVGRPRAFRAAGAANGANPVAIVVPCHRVIASDESLGGYGGGLGRKRWLLAHEAKHAAPR